ncbi:hypothetical protein BDW66DRAFT_142999 [Aspergillus desertorum]
MLTYMHRLRFPRSPVLPPRRHLQVTPRTMVKDSSTVIDEFNGLVNMTADELRDWLKEEQSQSSGWKRESGSGETIGHERYPTPLPTLPPLFPGSLCNMRLFVDA